MITCGRCRGTKEISGMGGIVRSCPQCKGIGQIAEATKEAIVEPVTIANTSQKPVDKKPKSKHDAKSKKSLEPESLEMFPITLIETASDSVKEILESSPSLSLSEVAGSLDMNEARQRLKKKPMLSGYSDSVMIALLDEPRMNPIEWRNKYKDVAEIFSIANNGVNEVMTKVERSSIRELYARAQPVAKRKVNLMSSQDMGDENDI